eukprot:31341-Pelagococcus_subviridis.AAC.6
MACRGHDLTRLEGGGEGGSRRPGAGSGESRTGCLGVVVSESVAAAPGAAGAFALFLLPLGRPRAREDAPVPTEARGRGSVTSGNIYLNRDEEGARRSRGVPPRAARLAIGTSSSPLSVSLGGSSAASAESFAASVAGTRASKSAASVTGVSSSPPSIDAGGSASFGDENSLWARPRTGDLTTPATLAKPAHTPTGVVRGVPLMPRNHSGVQQ